VLMEADFLLNISYEKPARSDVQEANYIIGCHQVHSEITVDAWNGHFSAILGSITFQLERKLYPILFNCKMAIQKI
jgi:hypothetical protein